MTVFANDCFLTGPKISHFQGFTVMLAIPFGSPKVAAGIYGAVCLVRLCSGVNRPPSYPTFRHSVQLRCWVVCKGTEIMKLHSLFLKRFALYDVFMKSYLIILFLETPVNVLNYHVCDIINFGALRFGVALVPKNVAIFTFRRP